MAKKRQTGIPTAEKMCYTTKQHCFQPYCVKENHNYHFVVLEKERGTKGVIDQLCKPTKTTNVENMF